MSCERQRIDSAHALMMSSRLELFALSNSRPGEFLVKTAH